MSKTVQLACTCGSVKGTLDIVPGAFFHVHCLCCDCQQFATYLGTEDKILDAHGGSSLFQTYPNYMSITEGQDKIASIKLSDKGLFRWYTTCCHMPLANTMQSAKLPFIGVSTKLMQLTSEQEKLDTIGPVTMKAFGQYALGEMPQDAHRKFPISYMPKIIWFMLKGMLLQKYKPSPFFINDAPVAKAKNLS